MDSQYADKLVVFYLLKYDYKILVGLFFKVNCLLKTTVFFAYLFLNRWFDKLYYL